MKKKVKRAFLVGINYRGSDSELGGCINDVLVIKDILIRNYGYSEDNIVLMSDDTEIKPTADNIIKGWKWLLSNNPVSNFEGPYIPLKSNEKGNYFFHYSGHGSQVRDRNGDERDGYDETICPIDYPTAGMIVDDVIRKKLAVKVPAKSKLICIIDACHSESSIDLLWTAKVASRGGFSLVKTGGYKQTKGDVIMLSGCRDNQTSADIEIHLGEEIDDNTDQMTDTVEPSIAHGALTYALVEVLKQANFNITCDDLLKNVREYIKDNGLSDQVPCLSFGKRANISRKFTL